MEIEKEEKIRAYFDRVSERGNDEVAYGENYREYSKGERGGILTTLAILGVKIKGVND
ncbi:hypothetical protein [Sporosarcina highlanderae]|uniref:Uncharacterized protein n=1 Tax=Sporosarcina highlanderae TaxID=3035916 RepID=A0ABT8JVN4_9BACL|nr:hypothetical protein [Sporosarcina highlanderae]MDN4609139.1 hypothetical protein [Sporosarcina highlanderae]